MAILESGENYLETILILQQKKGYVRSIDIAAELGFTKPSISRAMGILKKNELIVMDKGGRIQLTEKGWEKAEQVYERHCLIAKYFIAALGIDEETADSDACRIEHVISEQSFEKMKLYVNEHCK
ncbi:metal-dependent transcriptional regulator [Acetanaerobacterium elongatum]|uniref:Iron (Metal) dependent repressor, DtxR family n=1 Tax=Acetanaerobacterium elongatum TaxID=258515 RepID=A0A1G9ZJ34_9FIRM|nr:metal-dependent transcriptional regulator [Acetanaerobacterium elongatum]SDN21310.1 iron (metal) dependent repressor, DtxR family [Acetanaerobacterium elongatum]